jgi:K(+)-stimulated pyrophosphate-energized sodium pump
MTLATRGNVRTAAAALTNSMPRALTVAFRTGGVAGMFTVGLGLLGATVIIMLFQNTSSVMLVGFGFGGSLLALFLRVGGGIFTKAADVGADLVGKVEAGIPRTTRATLRRSPTTWGQRRRLRRHGGRPVRELRGDARRLDHPRRGGVQLDRREPGTRADLPARLPCDRGDRVDLRRVRGEGARRRDRRTQADQPRLPRRGLLTLAGTLAVALLYVGNDFDNAGWKCFGAVAIGLVLAQLISRLTEYYTGTHYRPVKDIADSAETGPATVVLSGTASGMESSVYAVIAIAIAIGVALVIGGGNLQFSFYLVALTGMGMLATTGVIVSEDTFGPVSDNAAGIAEMSGEFHGEAEKIMVSLDAVGNTTKAVTKGSRSARPSSPLSRSSPASSRPPPARSSAPRASPSCRPHPAACSTRSSSTSRTRRCSSGS